MERSAQNISHGDGDSDEGGHGTSFPGVNHLHARWLLNVNVLPVGDVRHQTVERLNYIQF